MPDLRAMLNVAAVRKNDEGWYADQCRYGKAAPAWGEFYELLGDDEQRLTPMDWHGLVSTTPEKRHFLFYLRNDTFECLAGEWRFERGIPAK